MNIKEYLQKKYGVRIPTTMTSAEADSFGIPYPLVKGWLSKHGDAEITEYMREKLLKKFGKPPTNKQKLNKSNIAYKQVGINILKSGPVTITKTTQQAPRPSQYRGAYIDPNGTDFLSSYQWRTLRFDAIAMYGNSCACCGATPSRGNGVVINVDHIKPRKTHPHLALDIDNLQVLCDVCNHGKSNRHETDFRAPRSDAGLDAYSMDRISEVLQSLK